MPPGGADLPAEEAGSGLCVCAAPAAPPSSVCVRKSTGLDFHAQV